MRIGIWILLALLGFPDGAASQESRPSPDPAQLRPGTDTLSVYFVQGHDTVLTGIIVDEISVDSSANPPRLHRVYWSQDRILGERLDTIIDLLDDLSPVAYRSRTLDGSQSLEFTGDRVTGWMILANGDSVAINVAVDETVLNSASFDLALRSFPLANGFHATVPGFIAQTRSVVPFSARVTGVEAMTKRDCWVVRAEFAGMPVTFWIDVETRRLCQQVMQPRADTQILFAPARSSRDGS